MNKKKKIILIIILILLIMSIFLLLGYNYYKGNNDKKTYKQEDSIKSYNYTLDDRDTKLMKDTFKKLKSTLNKEDIDYKEYAILLSELYIIDIFTIDNKINKYDTPSLEYILEDNIENFSNNISDTLYKYLIDNSDNSRKQDLPIVESIKYTNIEESTYTYKDIEYNGYKVSLNWTYKKDYGYDDSAIIDVINKDNKLYIVGYEGVNNEEN
jgi:hypothetical protein